MKHYAGIGSGQTSIEALQLMTRIAETLHESIIKTFHPQWGNLSQGVKKLMIRNSAQVFGPSPKNKDQFSQFVIC